MPRNQVQTASNVSFWDQIWEDTAVGWRYLYNESVKSYEDFVREDPEASAQQVAAFKSELEASRGYLDTLHSKLPPTPTDPADVALAELLPELETRWHELAVGFYRDVLPADELVIGFVPIFIVAGLAIGIGAASWSFAAYHYAVNLREKTALVAKELEARQAAAAQGQVLQPSTLPFDDSDEETTSKLGAALIAGGFGVAVVLLLLNR